MTHQHRAPGRYRRRAHTGRGTYQTTSATGVPHRHRASQAGRGHTEAVSATIHTVEREVDWGNPDPAYPVSVTAGGPHTRTYRPEQPANMHEEPRHEGGRHLTTSQPADRPGHRLCERERVWKEATARRPFPRMYSPVPGNPGTGANQQRWATCTLPQETRPQITLQSRTYP